MKYRAAARSYAGVGAGPCSSLFTGRRIERRLHRELPSPWAVAEALGGGRVDVVPVPHDRVDGFCHAWWRRPHAYLDPAVRASISGIARLPRPEVDRAVTRLGDDLSSGRWHATHADVLEIDAGYRLVVSHPGGATP